MSDPPAVGPLARNRDRNRAQDRLHLATLTPAAATTLTFDGVEPVESAVPDWYCALVVFQLSRW